MPVYILPWHHASKGAGALSKELGIRKIRLESSKFVGGPNKWVIIWGNAKPSPEVLRSNIVNSNAHLAVNKLTTFQKLSEAGVNIPDFSTKKVDVLRWVAKGRVVIGRTTLTGRGGQGIYFSSDFPSVENFLDSRKYQLYTVYKPKKKEYRVHVFDGRVIRIQQKVLRKEDDYGNPIDPATIDFRIRSWDNGFIFQRNNIVVEDGIHEQAIAAVRALDLQFAGVDVIWNEHENKAYVLELNTSPGIEGETIREYGEAFRRFFGERNVAL